MKRHVPHGMAQIDFDTGMKAERTIRLAHQHHVNAERTDVMAGKTLLQRGAKHLDHAAEGRFGIAMLTLEEDLPHALLRSQQIALVRTAVGNIK